jgi:hypothetical protein
MKGAVCHPSTNSSMVNLGLIPYGNRVGSVAWAPVYSYEGLIMGATFP